MNTIGRLLIIFALSSATTWVWAQQSTATKKLADNGPSLEVTMRFIQDKLDNRGAVSYIALYHDNNTNLNTLYTWNSNIGNIVADPSDCRISYHLHIEANGKVTADQDSKIKLRSIEKVLVMTAAQGLSADMARSGSPNVIVTQTHPEFFTVRIKQQDSEYSGFVFDDLDTANRIGKALIHAADLCGSGHEEPF